MHAHILLEPLYLLVQETENMQNVLQISGEKKKKEKKESSMQIGRRLLFSEEQ